MNKTTNISLIDSKIEDLKKQIAALKVDETLSKNTRGTKLYKLGRDRRTLQLIRSLVDQVGDGLKLSDADKETFVLITTLSEERAERSSVIVQEGDSIQELLERYQDKKDVFKKLTAACEKAGLRMDFASNSIVKA